MHTPMKDVTKPGGLTAQRARRLRHAALACLFMAGAASAQEFPQRTVRIILPSGPGAGLDVMARLVAAKLQAAWGQSVVLEHRAGTNGIVGTLAVKNMPADGYTLLIASSSYGANASLYADPGYDYRKDFAPVAAAFNSVYYFVVRGDGAIKSIPDLVRMAREKPGLLNHASVAQSWSQRLGMEKFRIALSLDMTYVPYKTQPDAMRSLVAGDVHLMNVGLPAFRGLLSENRVRALSIGAKTRSATLSDVPTMEEAGGPRGFESGGWTGFIVRAEVPAAIRERLRLAMVTAQRDPEIREFYRKSDFTPLDMSGEEFWRFILAEAEADAALIKAIGVKAEGR